MAGSTSLLWIGAGLVGLISIAPGLDRAASSAAPVEGISDGYAISRAPDGQFYVDGIVGGATVRFLVDPEAEGVLIAGPDAERIGLPSTAATLTLDRIAVGPTRQADIPVRLAPAIPVSLLGRSYLSRLAVADVQGDWLILR